jgi:hypothetical protein
MEERGRRSIPATNAIGDWYRIQASLTNMVYNIQGYGGHLELGATSWNDMEWQRQILCVRQGLRY